MRRSDHDEYEVFTITNTGAVRTQNEDHILALRVLKNSGYTEFCLSSNDDYVARYGLLLAVSDGIGGERGGRTASRLALKTLDQQFSEYAKKDDLVDYRAYLEKAIARTNDRILESSAQNPSLKGMGCTISGVCMGPSGYLVFNVGDSRVYRVRNGFLKLLTRDDTVAQERVSLGRPQSTPEQFEIENRTLTDFIGKRNVVPTIDPGPTLRINDTLLICSDGVHDLISEDVLSEIFLDSSQSLSAKGETILETALANGGHDNISLILLRLKPARARVEAFDLKSPASDEAVQEQDEAVTRSRTSATSSQINKEPSTTPDDHQSHHSMPNSTIANLPSEELAETNSDHAALSSDRDRVVGDKENPYSQANRVPGSLYESQGHSQTDDEPQDDTANQRHGNPLKSENTEQTEPPSAIEHDRTDRYVFDPAEDADVTTGTEPRDDQDLDRVERSGQFDESQSRDELDPDSDHGVER